MSHFVWTGIRSGFLYVTAMPFGIDTPTVFAMVFGHAPIIFPAVLRTPVPYSPLFYGHLSLLHLTLAVRLAGDLAGNHGWRALGGAGNALALLLFLVMTIGSGVRGRFQKSA